MFPYLKLLIRQRIAAWNPVNSLRVQKSKLKVILQYFAFFIAIVTLYGMLVAMEYFLYGAFEQIGDPITMLALTGILCTLLTVVTSFFYIFNELFFSKDIAFVSALPISSRGLLTAKLIRIWLGEAGIALAICLPVVILYGVGQSQSVWFFVKALLLIPFIPMVPIAVVTLLSFLLIRVSALWKRREALTVVMSMVFLMVFMWADMQFSMMGSGENSMNAMVLQLVLQQRSLWLTLSGLYPPIQLFVNGITLDHLQAGLQWIGFAALNLGVIALIVAALGGSYQRLAVRQNETLTRMNARANKRADRHGQRTPLMAMYRREVREIFMVPIYATNCLASAVMFPIIALAMVLGAGSNAPELAALPKLLGLLPKPLITAIITGIFALTASVNMACSTAVSREGKRHEFYRTLPVAPASQLLAKLLMGLTIAVVCILPMAILAAIALPDFLWQIVIGFLCAMALMTVTTTLSLMIDANHPKFGWKSETEAIKQNGIAAISMFGAMAAVMVSGGALYGLTVLGLSVTAALAIIVGMALVADGLLIRRLLHRTAETYISKEVLL